MAPPLAVLSPLAFGCLCEMAPAFLGCGVGLSLLVPPLLLGRLSSNPPSPNPPSPPSAAPAGDSANGLKNPPRDGELIPANGPANCDFVGVSNVLNGENLNGALGGGEGVASTLDSSLASCSSCVFLFVVWRCRGIDDEKVSAAL